MSFQLDDNPFEMEPKPLGSTKKKATKKKSNYVPWIICIIIFIIVIFIIVYIIHKKTHRNINTNEIITPQGPGIAVNPHNHDWLWITLGVIVLFVIIGVIIYFISESDSKKKSKKT